jgi:hypothetical protein
MAKDKPKEQTPEELAEARRVATLYHVAQGSPGAAPEKPKPAPPPAKVPNAMGV